MNRPPPAAAETSPQATAPCVAYLVNQYPKVSHTFIRREILALERLGVKVMRVSIRGWADTPVDEADRHEQRHTRYVLQDGLRPLLAAAARQLRRRPQAWRHALALAWRLGRRGDRPLPYHLVYFLEACLLVEWLAEAGATHLHAHFGTNPAEVALLSRALGGPRYSFTVHGPEEFDKPERLALREKMAGSAFVAAISEFGRSQLYRWAALTDWPKVRVVHCGLDSGFLDAAPSPVPAAPRLVCVGRLCEQKGQLVLVQALAALARDGLAWELVLAGDGEMRAALEAEIARHALQPRVRITGWIDGAQVREELRQARAMVLPSFAEGLPVALMEAMALQRPVVTTWVAGIPELVRDGEEGWLVPAGSVQALQAALREVLQATAQELTRRGEAARARVRERHHIEVSARRLLALFAQPAGAAGSASP